MKLQLQIVFHAPWMRTAFLAVVGLFGALVAVAAVVASASADTPDLPAEIRQEANGQMILLDFFSPFCGACQMMEPHIERLRAKTEGQLFLKRLDLSNLEHKPYMERYDISGTPTYVLFNAQGRPLYRMESLISPAVLEKQVLRQTQQLEAVAMPQSVLETVDATPVTLPGNTFQNLLLVSVEGKDCDPCKDMAPYLTGFGLIGQQGLDIVQVDKDSAAG